MRSDTSDNRHADDLRTERQTPGPKPGKAMAAKPDNDGNGKSTTTPSPSTPPREPEVYSRMRADTAKPAKTPDEHDSHASKPPTAPIPAPREPMAPATGRAEVARPGETDSLLPKGSRDNLHERWQALQLRFVDDPKAVATEAGGLVEEALRELRDALGNRKRELDVRAADEGADTEGLRRTVRDYRDLLGHVVGH